MTSIAGLEKRLRRLVDRLEPEGRTWTFALEPNEPIPASAAARIRPNDHVIVVEIPAGYLSISTEEEGSS